MKLEGEDLLDVLAPVEESARLLAVARGELEYDIRRAHREGASLRQIAGAAEVSYEKVRRIVQSVDA